MNLLDHLLGAALAPDERTARGLILSGRVLVDDRAVTSEHASVPEGAAVRVRGDVSSDVSRGVRKLTPALERCGFDPAGRICLDLGVSTGGFTQVLLQRGAARVYAVDVSYGLTAPEVRSDTRVTLLERTNVRALTPALIPAPVERVVGDLSFISWRLALPPVIPLLAPDVELLLLLKPQFELDAAARDRLDRGVLRAPADQRAALAGLYDTWRSAGLRPRAVVPSGLPGAKGNREYFVHLDRGAAEAARTDYELMTQQAVSEATA